MTTSKLTPLEVKPFSGAKAKNLVVFLHGLGSNGDDLLGLVPYFHEMLPDCHFYSPNGIEVCDMGPWGYQWFSLKNRDHDIIANEVRKNEPKILDLIESKLNELQLTFEDLVLIGFSQGTMMSLYLTHSLSTKIAAVVGFSGAFYPPEVINNIETPVCLIHGTDDEVVSFSSLDHAKEKLSNFGVKNVETYAIKNLGHSIDLSGLKHAASFLLKYLKK